MIHVYSAPALSFNQARRLLTPLNVDRDLKLIINELAPVAHNWDVLGTCLPGLKYSEVKEIKKKQLEPKNALLSVIERWLATADRTVTWNDILDALREPILSENHLAEQIKEKICSQTSKFIHCILCGLINLYICREGVGLGLCKSTVF